MAVPTGNPDEPLQELKHDPVPGYPKAFVIAFLVMGLYLLLILLSSPGPAEGHHGSDGHEAGHGDPKSHHETESTH